MALFPLSPHRQMQSIPMVAEVSLILSCISHSSRSIWTKEQVRSLPVDALGSVLSDRGGRPEDLEALGPRSVGFYKELEKSTTLAI